MEQRLMILHENSVIDQDVYHTCLKIHEGLMSENSLTDVDAYSVAMTHLAMAMQRIKQDNITGMMDSSILEQIQEDDLFDKVKEFTDLVLENVAVVFPESEIQFLWLHFLTVLKQKGGKE